jgi:hypothetical protein
MNTLLAIIFAWGVVHTLKNYIESKNDYDRDE